MDPVITPGATGIRMTIKDQGGNSGDGEDDEMTTYFSVTAVGNRRQQEVVKSLGLGKQMTSLKSWFCYGLTLDRLLTSLNLKVITR